MTTQIPSFIKRLQASQFVRHNLMAFTGSITVATINYLYYPVLGRVMHPADFGEVQAINSLATQVTVFLSVFGILTVSAISRYDNDKTRDRVVAELEKVATFLIVAIVAVLLASSLYLMHFFKFQSLYPLLILFISLLIAVPAAFRNSYLQGLKDFGATAKAGAISASGKLIFGLILVLIGWQAAGAVAGALIAQVLALLYAAHRIRRHGWVKPLGFRRFSRPNMSLLAPEFRFARLVLATTFSLSCFMSLDILAVKHLFDPTTAGLFAGIETLGRIVFFVNASVATVLLPSIQPSHTSGENQRLLRHSLLLICGLGLSVLTVFTLVPNLVVEILMGTKFLPYAHLLPWLGLLAFISAVLNLLFYYYLAQRRNFVGFAAVAGLLASFTILGLYHGTPDQVVQSLLAGATLMLIFTISFGRLTKR